MKPVARFSLSKRFYPKAALVGAALALGRRARASLSGDAKRWFVEIEPVSAGSGRTLAGEFLNEALSQARRISQLRDSRPFAAAIASRVLSRGFVRAPVDPLEQLEPQVRVDRSEEIESLLDRARRLP